MYVREWVGFVAFLHPPVRVPFSAYTRTKYQTPGQVLDTASSDNTNRALPPHTAVRIQTGWLVSSICQEKNGDAVRRDVRSEVADSSPVIGMSYKRDDQRVL